MTQPDPDAVMDDERILEALRSCREAPTEDRVVRLLAALRDETRADPNPLVSGWYEDPTGRWRHTSDTAPAVRVPPRADGWCEDRTPGHELTHLNGID